MPVYEITNSTTGNINLRAGPNVVYGIIGSLASGRKGKGDFIMTYQQPLVIDDSQRGLSGDQWVHVTELDSAPVDGWMAIRHLGNSYATYAEVPGATVDVSFGVDLEGYQPITLTGTLKPK